MRSRSWQQGATIVDPADIPRSPRLCRDEGGMRGKDVNCSIVFKYGMKRDFNAWLASLGPASPIKTLTELREWNLAHRAEGAIKYGQAQLDNSDDVISSAIATAIVPIARQTYG